MFQVKGINHKTGNFNGKDYDNYQLFGIKDNGLWAMIKIQAHVLSDAGIKDYKMLVNNKVEILYNEYGSVEKIRLG